MRTVLISQADEPLSYDGLSRWLASFSDVAGVVVLHETSKRMWRRIHREIQRVGAFRFLDVLAFRLYYRVCLLHRDKDWEADQLAILHGCYPALASSTPVLHADSPNTAEVEQFLRETQPDLMIARCKTLLKEQIFRIPTRGTFVMHPGICPEYRNAHGCFWALARNDLRNVGMTLLRINAGVDTGPIYGYYRCSYDECHDSHVVIQHKTVFDNLDAIGRSLVDIYRGTASPLDVSNRCSGEWGQPWLTAYLAWKRRAWRRSRRVSEEDTDAYRASVP